ncbi:hypothetical protein BT63DRAFT_421055 [Microthyrium microscopicum]|uniref:Uncharacterized protein n=1 Tax=Microthyrium microscopicum TaxID=703497 RepID=A0A6A6UMY2_9PEZI|nr:hypothetical protein BT63DRAFT_421055 [Microthyrium microscopicum]
MAAPPSWLETNVIQTLSKITLHFTGREPLASSVDEAAQLSNREANRDTPEPHLSAIANLDNSDDANLTALCPLSPAGEGQANQLGLVPRQQQGNDAQDAEAEVTLDEQALALGRLSLNGDTAPLDVVTQNTLGIAQPLRDPAIYRTTPPNKIDTAPEPTLTSKNNPPARKKAQEQSTRRAAASSSSVATTTVEVPGLDIKPDDGSNLDEEAAQLSRDGTLVSSPATSARQSISHDPATSFISSKPQEGVKKNQWEWVMKMEKVPSLDPEIQAIIDQKDNDVYNFFTDTNRLKRRLNYSTSSSTTISSIKPGKHQVSTEETPFGVNAEGHALSIQDAVCEIANYIGKISRRAVMDKFRYFLTAIQIYDISMLLSPSAGERLDALAIQEFESFMKTLNGSITKQQINQCLEARKHGRKLAKLMAALGNGAIFHIGLSKDRLGKITYDSTEQIKAYAHLEQLDISIIAQKSGAEDLATTTRRAILEPFEMWKLSQGKTTPKKAMSKVLDTRMPAVEGNSDANAYSKQENAKHGAKE